MADTEQINVQIDQNALSVVLDAFRHMRDTPSGVDYSMLSTPSPEEFVNLIAKLEEHQHSEHDPVTIPMNDHEWFGYTSFIYYGARIAELDQKISDFLDKLDEQYSDWEDNGFKLDDASNGPA